MRTHNLPSGRLKKRLWWIQWRDVSMCRKKIRTHFLHPGHRKKRFRRSPLSDYVGMRMALRTQNLPCGSLNKQISWSRSNVSKFQKAMRTHFLHLEHRKIDFDELAYDILSRRMTVRTHSFWSSCKTTLVKSMKRWFKVSKENGNSFSESCASKNVS
jgi:hypothetical protein